MPKPLIPDPRVDQRLRDLVSAVLSEYPIEEVQAALNLLVENSRWLEEHRRVTSPEQKAISGKIASLLREEAGKSSALEIYRATSD